MITVNAKGLVKTLENNKKFLNTKASLAILGAVLMRLDGNDLVLSSTNLTERYDGRVSCQGGSPFLSTVAIPNIQNLLKTSKFFGETIDIETEGADATFYTGNKSIKMEGYEPELFPPENPVDAKPVGVDIPEIVSVYKKIKHAIIKDEERPTLECVCFRNNIMIAADGFKIAAVPLKQELNKNFLLHYSVMDKLNLFEKDGQVSLRIKEGSQVDYQIESSRSRLTGWVDKMNFPDTSIFNPKDNPKEKWQINRKEWIDALTFLDVADGDMVKFEKGVLSTFNSDDKYDVKTSCVNEITMGFNKRFVLDMIKTQFDEENVFVEIYAHNRPMWFTDGNIYNGYSILMPCHLG